MNVRKECRMTWISRFIVSSAIALICSCIAAADDLQTLRDNLRQNFGEAYESSKTQALALSDAEFDMLLAPWEAMADDTIEQIIADGVRARRDQPQSAALFDAWVDDAVANPDTSNRAGRPRYFWGMEPLAEDHCALAFEAVVKRDMPRPARNALTRQLYKCHLDGILALVKSEAPEDTLEEISWAAIDAVERLTRRAEEWQADATTRNKIIVPLVAWYKKWRSYEQHYLTQSGFQMYVPAVVVISRIETPEALVALNELVIWEQTINMPVQGLSPWDDNTALGDLSALRRSEFLLRQEIREQQRAGQPVAQLEQELESLMNQYPNAQKRANSIYGWRNLVRMRDVVAAKLTGQPVPTMSEYYPEIDWSRYNEVE